MIYFNVGLRLVSGNCHISRRNQLASANMKIRHVFADTRLTGGKIAAIPPVISLLSGCSTQFLQSLIATRLKTHRLFQVDIDRREQCCAANYEQVVNHVVPSCYS